MKKINLENMKNVLTRDEMKKIVGGSGGSGGGGILCSTETQTCCTDADCGTDKNCYCYRPEGQTSSACYTRH